MKLAIVLADASTRDARGGLSALGLGIAQLTVDRIPGQFHGALVVILSPEATDPLMGKFSLTLEVPGHQPQQFALGEYKASLPQEQVVLSQSFDLLVTAEGPHVFRIECGGASAETRLRAVLKPNEVSASHKTRETK